MVAGAKDNAQLARARNRTFDDFVKVARGGGADPYLNWSAWRSEHAHRSEWAAARHGAGDVDAYRKDTSVAEWSAEKIQAYNHHLSGKVIIPQPFGRLRNLHEPATTLINPTDRWGTDGFVNQDDFGFCISRFMLIEVAVGLILWIIFSWVASKMARGGAPHGRMWNLFESFVAFIRNEIARPALGGHHESHEEGHHAPEAAHAATHDDHGHGAKHAPAHHDHDDPVTRYTPILCTIFFFILGCNLAGMLPWVGSPTGTWAVTLAMAVITLGAVTVAGMRQFGFWGFFLNQIPSMDLPWYMALFLKPILLVIELLGFVIKHGVLSVRLLANMLAGHMVLLAIMSLAFGLEASLMFTQPDGSVSVMWWVASIASVVGCTLLSMLELFVAFLQAYVFTLLSALFLGAAIHKH
jgi:F-type H+-transporting ATPase subunit a